MKKNKIVIVHGWEGHPEKNWFPWLKNELEKINCDVLVPTMPDTMNPVMAPWLDHLFEVAGEINEHTYFVGHSLGVMTILRFLELLPEDTRAGGMVLVAGFPESIGYEEINSFFQSPLQYNKVTAKTKNIVAINSDNDPYFPLHQGELLRDNLGAEFIVMHDAGHINERFGYKELPIVLEKLKEMMN